MTFLDIAKLEQDRNDLIEIINSYRELTGNNPVHRRYLACHLVRLDQLDDHIDEWRKSNPTSFGNCRLLSAA